MNPWATDCCNVTYTGLEQPIIQIIDDIGCIYECKYNLFLIYFFLHKSADRPQTGVENQINLI